MSTHDYIVLRRKSSNNIEHSAKGSEWEDHKYVKKINGVYYYPVGYEDGRTIESLKQDKRDVTDKLDEVWNHFDQYLAKRGIDWRTLPKDEVDEMQRFIAGQLESGKETGTPEKTAEELAKDVIAGKLGSGEDRKKLLGDSYNEVQRIVNSLLKGPTGSKPISEASSESVKKVEEIIKGIEKSNVVSGIDINEVLKVYNKKKE